MSTALPPGSTRDMSFHQAMAGQAAQSQAEALGGDPADLRAILAAGQVKAPATVCGVPLHGFSLTVMMDLALAQTVLGANPLAQLSPLIVRLDEDVNCLPAPEELRALMLLGLIFTRPEEAFGLLDDIRLQPADSEEAEGCRQDLERRAMEVTGGWKPYDMGQFIRHLLTLGKPVPSGQMTTP